MILDIQFFCINFVKFSTKFTFSIPTQAILDP